MDVVRLRRFSAGSALAVLLGAAGPDAYADLFINEILASNTFYVVEDFFPDLVEIYNSGPEDIVLGDPHGRYALTDHPFGHPRHWWHFPIGTVIRAGGYLTIACDASARFGLHANFWLCPEDDDDKGKVYPDDPFADCRAGAFPRPLSGVVALMAPEAKTIVDLVEYRWWDACVSYARIPDGSENWRHTSACTFFWGRIGGEAEPVCADRSLAFETSLCDIRGPLQGCPDSPANVLEENFVPDIDQVRYRPTIPRSDEEVIVTCRMAVGRDQAAVELHYATRGPGADRGPVTLIPMRDDGEGPDELPRRSHGDWKNGAGDGWWVGVIPPHPAGTTVLFWLTARLREGDCEDREPGVAHAPPYNLYTVENEDKHGLRVNEVLVLNDSVSRNGIGSYSPWVEIYNPSDHEVDLAGYYLTDNPRQPFRWAFPSDKPELTEIAAGGHVLVWLDKMPFPGPELHAYFGLDEYDESVYLANEKGVFDGIDFADDPLHPGPEHLLDDRQDGDISLGRVPDGADTIGRILHPSPGGPNPVGPLPVVRELRAAPDSPSRRVPCGSPSFAAFGENLAAAALVGIRDPSGPLEPEQVAYEYDTLHDALVIHDGRCGHGDRRELWVYSASVDDAACVASKVKFHCVPQIAAVEPPDPSAGALGVRLCGFDSIVSAEMDGTPIGFYVDRGLWWSPEKIILDSSCADGVRHLEILDADGYAQEADIPPCPAFLRGDGNADGSLDLADAVAVLGYLFADGRIPCLDAADLDDDGFVRLGDPITLLNFLFAGGPAPAEPYLSCATDPTPDGLNCAHHSPCQ